MALTADMRKVSTKLLRDWLLIEKCLLLQSWIYKNKNKWNFSNPEMAEQLALWNRII